ncbi:phosphatidylinositol-4-phosphate 5-kinase related [Anaeramoeba ignava]|uniref:Phosphatidylinositol-4-phosphate 5-kinase related n=1 Tax=Anaeramoeba ignava TaxID=1746090 RepID=A0A9Q0LXS2_ANAIG|nr:phosphatidylinositol-4-phosphate 5-kinase related [Anaeramoeba ignava]
MTLKKEVKVYHDRSIYEGETLNGMRHGYGVYRYHSGERYEGHWFLDKKHGRGKYFYTSGGIYDGEWDFGRKTGKGSFKFPSGDLYDGTWKSDKRDDFGIYNYSIGDRYEGYWYEDQKHGKGYYMFSSKSEYIGEWVFGTKEGFGRFNFNTGDIYEGRWKNEKRDGFGVYHYGRDLDRYEGMWRDDAKHGKGFYLYKNGDWYYGYWNKGKKQGMGIFHYADNGSEYIGFWDDNYRHGFGINYFGNGDVYRGYWRKDRKDGEGDYFYSNGDRYQGGWREDQKSGFGYYFYLNGDIFESFWYSGLKHDPEAKFYPGNDTSKVIIESYSDGVQKEIKETRSATKRPSFIPRFEMEESDLKKFLDHRESRNERPEAVIPSNFANKCEMVIRSCLFSKQDYKSLITENTRAISQMEHNAAKHFSDLNFWEWSKEQVSDWLDLLEIVSIKPLFLQHCIDGYCLQFLTESDLKEMEIYDLDLIQKILKETQNLKENESLPKNFQNSHLGQKDNSNLTSDINSNHVENDLRSIPDSFKKRLEEKNINIPQEYICPLSKELMQDPVILSDGYTYERKAIEEWITKSNYSPVDGSLLSDIKLKPNTALKELIEIFKDNVML